MDLDLKVKINICTDCHIPSTIRWKKYYFPASADLPPTKPGMLLLKVEGNVCNVQ